METDINVEGFKNCEQQDMVSDTFPLLVMVIAFCILASLRQFPGGIQLRR